MINDIFDELNKMFETVQDEVSKAKKQMKQPILTNVIENESSYEVSCALPGVDKSNVNINYENNELKVSVKETESEDIKYLIKERSNNFYDRTILLEGIDEGAIKARMENGILNITCPKQKKETTFVNID